jgi:YggT family protein
MIAGYFLKAFAQFFHLAIQLYVLIIIARAIISWMGNIPPNRFVVALRRLTDPVFRLFYRYIPFSIIGGIDISPVIIIILLYFVDNLFTGIMMQYSAKLITGG